MVHCMVMPVVLAALPLWSMAETLHDWLHPLFLVSLVPISVMALVRRGKPKAKSAMAVFLAPWRRPRTTR